MTRKKGYVYRLKTSYQGAVPRTAILVYDALPQVVPPFVCLADIDWLYSVRTCEGVHPEQDYRDGDGGHSEDDQE